jgi:DNA-binding MarR family transcriptional regulator
MDLDRSANDLLDLVSLVVRGLSGNRDLSLTAIATLGLLLREGPQRITVLAAVEGVSQPSMTQLVQRLEQRGLVTRESDPSDGRAALVILTSAGKAALAHRREQNAERIAMLLGDLPQADVDAFGDALATVLPAIRARLGAETHAASVTGR